MFYLCKLTKETDNNKVDCLLENHPYFDILLTGHVDLYFNVK